MRNLAGRVLVRIQDLLVLDGFSVFCAAFGNWFSMLSCRNSFSEDEEKKEGKEGKEGVEGNKQNSPRRCVIVVFSRAGSSVISTPNISRSSRCALSKTVLNCRVPCSPRTLALMSARRIGRREYSLDSARRTIFWIIAFVEDAGPASSDISASGDELRGLWRRDETSPESESGACSVCGMG